jgi:bifunctional UDP-N-acetylglucosamine pyrophosphorylase/glucosamine-1-phosphate N-acetyltransferase
MKNTAAVILAAGEGKRMKSSKPKVLHEVLFKPMIDWVTDSAEASGVDNICVVVGHGAEVLEEHLSGRFETAVQERRLGTGHAVMQAADFLRRHAPEDVVILNGDAPLISADVISASYAEHKASSNALTVITAKVADPKGYGRIVRGGGNVMRIVEEKDASDAEKQINEVNSGAYWFRTEVLLRALEKINSDNIQHEYYLTDTVEIVNEMKLGSGTYILPDPRVMAGANDRFQLLALNGDASERVFSLLLSRGVSIIDKSGIIVGPDVHIARDTVILPGTIIRGHSEIGEGCVIGPNSLIDDCVFGDGVVFNASQAYRSKVASGVTIGPFSQLRPNCDISERVHIGDFVEIKNSNIGAGTKVAHLTYVGDSDVGERVNFGCGCVTVNYDGVHKHRTTIGNDAFIGCNTNLIAPVKVGDRAYTAGGSTITRDVPDDALAVARSRQENKEGWVKRKRPPKQEKNDK